MPLCAANMTTSICLSVLKVTHASMNYQVAWAKEPFRGQDIDRPINGPLPSPWDVDVVPSCLFAQEEVKREIPHTASVRTCNVCSGFGQLRCIKCKGKRKKPCAHCLGGGRITARDASMKKRRIQCLTCQGERKALCSLS